MKRLHIIFLVAVSIISLNSVKLVRASIIDDFLSAIGVASENKEKNEENFEVIEKEVEEYLDSRQKEVVAEIDKIYKNIKNVDIDGLLDGIDYKLPKQKIADVKEYFDNYENGIDSARSIAGTLKYKIESVSNMGDDVIAKITYSYPSIPKVIAKVLPEILLKNAGILFRGEITNDILDSALNSIKNELNKDTYEVETFTREFTFRKIDGKWKVIDVDNIVKDLTKYINEVSSSIFKR